MKNWYVYIVECNDGSYYTGITTDVERRVNQHNSKKQGAKYTRARQPVKLIYSKGNYTKSSAAKEEYKIKQLTKKQKLAYIK